MIVCPGCGENNSSRIDENQQSHCVECGLDLTPLLRMQELFKLHYNYGLTLAKRGEFQAAIQALLTAAAINPRQEQAYVLLGKLFAGRKDYESARYYYEKALQLVPNHEKALADLAKIKILTAAVPRSPSKPGGVQWIGIGAALMVVLSMTLFFAPKIFPNRSMVTHSPVKSSPPAPENHPETLDYLYVIRAGDTGTKLARDCYGDEALCDRIQQANSSILANEYTWPVGAVIIIPGPLKKESGGGK